MEKFVRPSPKETQHAQFTRSISPITKRDAARSLAQRTTVHQFIALHKTKGTNGKKPISRPIRQPHKSRWKAGPRRSYVRPETPSISSRQHHRRRPFRIHTRQRPTPRPKNILISHKRRRFLPCRRSTPNRPSDIHMCTMPDITRPNHEPENGRFARNTPLENTAILQVWHRRLRTLQNTPW